MREFNLDHLRTLLAVVDSGSLSNAAAALHLAQPTISLHLRELESRLDIPLLKRNRHGVTVTAGGKILIDYARKLLALADQASEAVGHYRESVQGVVRLGASTGLITHEMPRLLQYMAQHRPEPKIELAVTTTAMAMEKLQADELDLALVGATTRHQGLVLTRWRSDPLMAFLPAAWTVPKRVSPAWLARQPLLMNEPGSALYHQTLQWFSRAGFFPRPRIALNNGEAIKGLVAAGYGAAVLPAEAGQSVSSLQIQVRPITPAMERPTFLACKKARTVPPSVKAVMEVLNSKAFIVQNPVHQSA